MAAYGSGPYGQGNYSYGVSLAAVTVSASSVAVATELGADLLVVGRRSEGGEPAPGSVSAEVVRRAACDVLVVG